jgi:antirestriction protein
MNHEQQTHSPVDAPRVAQQLTEAFHLFTAEEGWTAAQDHFVSHYRGTWASLADYGKDLTKRLAIDSEILNAIPDWLSPFVDFDYAAFARDDLQRDSFMLEGLTGLHVFDRFADPPGTGDVESTTPAA